MAGPLIADTGELLRAITRRPDGRPAWPRFARALATASRVVVPGPVLTEVDYFLHDNRPAMRQLVAQLFPATDQRSVALPQGAPLRRGILEAP